MATSDRPRRATLRQETAAQRLQRLLTLVPWLLSRQGVDLDEAAGAVGITRAQLEDDLELLFVCGPPRHGPEDLIDAQWEGGRVFLSNADDIAQPLRLTMDEAASLIVALKAVQAAPGAVDGDVVDRALVKLQQAAGDAAPVAERVQVHLADEAETQVVARAREAIQAGRRLHLDYLVASRDEATSRDVDPIRVISSDGHWYVEGWCHLARGTRLFRADRITHLNVLDIPTDNRARAGGETVKSGESPRESLYRPSADALAVELELSPEASWFSEYYPVRAVKQLPDGRQRVQLWVEEPRWIGRVVLGMGGSARVVSPPEVAALVREQAEAGLAAYQPVAE